MPKILSRREFVKLGALAGGCVYLTGRGSFFGLARADAAEFDASADASPMARLTGSFAGTEFNGDEFLHAHEALWDVDAYIRRKGGRPTSISFTTNVAVVGGGMSGLLSAYFLRDCAPVLFEQAPRFGGNAKAEIYGDTAFALGAAYIDVPKAGGDIDRMFGELGLSQRYRREGPDDVRVDLKGTGLRRFWSGESDPAASASFLQVEQELARINSQAYPDIPWTSASTITFEQYLALDRQTVRDWLTKTFTNLHPQVEEYFQLYCWSSLGGSLDEISAAQFLNFIAAETDGVVAFPGGNGLITAALYESLKSTLPQGSLVPGTLVLEVRNVSDGVEILFENTAGVLQILKARFAVVGAPKYVARRIVTDLPADRNSFWESLPYRAYVVANVLLKNKIQDPSYDIYCLRGSTPPRPWIGSPMRRPWTDVICADWANGGTSSASVLTIYRPYPFDGARNVLYSETSFARIRSEVLAELAELLPDFGATAADLGEVRLTRWGHSIPLARPGFLTSEAQNFLGAPHGRIAFANQDSSMNPAFETCFDSSRRASQFVRQGLVAEI